MRYMINPPKLVDREILYRHIVVSIYDEPTEDNPTGIIGAHEYQGGQILPRPTTELPKPVLSMVKENTEIATDFDLTQIGAGSVGMTAASGSFYRHCSLNTKSREFWSFPTAEMAHTQKLIMLAKIREKILMDIKDDQESINKLIPETIHAKIDEMKNNHPEYYL